MCVCVCVCVRERERERKRERERERERESERESPRVRTSARVSACVRACVCSFVRACVHLICLFRWQELGPLCFTARVRRGALRALAAAGALLEGIRAKREWRGAGAIWLTLAAGVLAAIAGATFLHGEAALN